MRSYFDFLDQTLQECLQAIAVGDSDRAFHLAVTLFHAARQVA